MTNPLNLARLLTFCSLLAGTPLSMAHHFPFFPMGLAFQKTQTQGMEPTLVRVSIVTKFRGAKETVQINGKLFTEHRPIIIRAFASTGIVLNQQGDVLTFLGYRWLEIQNHNPTIEVSRDGQKWKGKLIGIDQRNGVAVIRLIGGKLKKTPICEDCEVTDGAVVMAPEAAEVSQLRRAQVVSIGTESATPDPGGLMLTLDHPFPDIGQPILTADHRVLGFIASQDPMGIRNIVYPIAQLLASADKIIKTGGDICAGWLGLFLVDSNPAIGPGVLVQRIEPDSPAQKAGLAPGDFLLKYNGERIRNISHYIQLVEGSSIGSKATVEIIRRGKPVTLSALIEARRPQPDLDRLSLLGVLGFPVAGILPEPASRNQRLLIGVDTILLDQQLAESLQMPISNGVLVIDVQKGSPAEAAGVLIGDVIVSIDGQPITGGLELMNFLQTHDWNPQVLLQINRKGIESTIPVQISNR